MSTPMIQQYRRIKAHIPPDALLLFRLGDFYEMFFEDAKLGAQLLNLTLTQRNGMPMCGIPYHAAEGYIGRLLRAGRKVAICDQLETPKPGKLVARDVTQILSPGTHFDAHLLQASQPNWLAALCRNAHRYGLALMDLTTGTFRVTELETEEACRAELQRVRPAEILAPQSMMDSLRTLGGDSVWTGYEDWTFEPETAYHTLRDHFKTQSLDGFGASELTVGIAAAGAALHYLQHALRRDLRHVHRLQVYRVTDFLVLDAATQRNLELVESARGDRRQSLLGCLDRTITPMGARLLRDWLMHPLQDLEAIRARQDVIGFFMEHPHLLADLREKLEPVRDLERTLGRLTVGTGNARDLVALRQALEAVPAVRAVCQPTAPLLRHEPLPRPRLLEELVSQVTELPDLVELLRRAIQPAPPLSLKEGGLIQPGYHPPLDELRRAAREGKDWIAALQEKEIQRTGISSLKIRYNSVFGYFIEITRANLDKVPPDYIRKQTIANGERFYTEELKAMEHQILGAEEKANALEYELFLDIRQRALAHSEAIQQTARALAALDVLASLAEVARHYNYCRPEVHDGTTIEIHDGRHPVLEQTLVAERFVPNDVRLDDEQHQILIITGPNMAGKSTYIRQVALLVLLAHTGSFIPARQATIGLVDRIFTRIGATDDLARGQSTFLVEMNETANILHHATRRSLVILDEIGRGTSTFDGLSIAWAVVEYLHNEAGAKTLFATHYHELTELAHCLPRVKNYNVAVREWHDQIIFLHKILPGGTDKSYGIHVARLAGLPAAVIARAKEVLANLEQTELTAVAAPKSPRVRSKPTVRETPQLSLFPPPNGNRG